ncbi:hypothetical protein GH714_008759 [Hevea brasiliensis]|uniref:DUF7746 domain-containing protein n=1 Tax=Hevea brasiliensis TaxID=3981 RepID=A0A6A6LN33_HEVBR|nr:hypothetical protein GH714_008759 [Hevea brasiliensis]
MKFRLEISRKSFPDFEDQQFLVTLESAYRNFITPKGKTLRGVHPPLTEISYKVSENQEFECSPFSKSDKQGNYANLSLYTIGQQLTRIETQVQTFKSREYRPEKGETSKSSLEKKVLFKPVETDKTPIKLGGNSEIVDELTKRLAELGLEAKDSKKKTIAPLTRSLNIQEELEQRLKALIPNLRENTTKLITPKGTTTFFVTDLQKGNLVVPKSIAWEQVNLPDSWILEEAIPPKKEESEDVESIIETNNGTVAISFARTRSRNSFSGRSVVSEPIRPRTSLSGIDLDRFSSIGIHRTEEQIAQPIYGPESTVASPIETVRNSRKSFPDFEDQQFLVTLESAYRNFITPKGKTLRGVHPPLTEISYKVSENQEFECSPFSKSDKQGNYANLSLYTIGQQLTRVETQLQTFKSREYRPEKGETSKSSLEKKVLFKPVETDKTPIKLGGNSEIVDELTKRLAELGLEAKDSKKKTIAPLTRSLNIQEELEQRLKALSIAPLSQGQEETETESEDSSNTEEQINSLEVMFKEPEPQPLEVNRLVYPKPRATVEMKPYYPRPSPINLQFEDTSYNYVQFDGTSIVEWNIDGLSEYQIKNTIHFMTMENTTKLITPKGTTTFFVTDLQKGNLVVPKSIAWEQVNLPDSWILEEAIPPKKEESEDVESIIETNNGTVAISFARTRSRNSFSGRSVVSEPIRPRTSLSGIDLDRFSSIGIHRTEEQIAQPIYGPESTVASPIETVSLKRPESPTPSDMGYEKESVRTQT